MARSPKALSEDDIARRRGDAIKRALETPHTPTKAIKGKTREKPKNDLANNQSQEKP